MLNGRKSTRWVWYASRSERPVYLNAEKYPSIEFDGDSIPRPEWVCQAENGGLHIDARIGRIDIHVVSSPKCDAELNWTEPYSVKVVSNHWLDTVRDLIDLDRVFIGSLFDVDQRVIDGWCSLHGVKQPPLKSARMTKRVCKRCGNVSTWPRGKEYFDAPNIGHQVLLVNANGIYLREDVVREREISAPIGCYEPTFVQWKA